MSDCNKLIRMKINYFAESDIGIIELDNQPYNLLTSPIFIDPDELTEFLNNNQFKGIVIKGAGRNFCAGANPKILEEQIQNPDEFTELMKTGKKIIDMIQTAPLPIVATVQGSCLGAGLEIALACHFIFASKNAMFGFPESELKLMPGLGGTVLSGGRLSRKHIIKLMLSAEMINGIEAQSIGLVDQVHRGKDIVTKSIEYLQSITTKRPAHLIRTIMQSIHNSELMSRDEALKFETENFIKLARQLDSTENTK